MPPIPDFMSWNIVLPFRLVFIATGQPPPIVVVTGHPTSLVFALDLSLLVPALVIGALWLVKRRPWGYVIAAVTNVKGTVYTLSLAAGSVIASKQGIQEAIDELPLWLLLTAGNAAAAGSLLRHARRHGQTKWPRRAKPTSSTGDLS